jgi:cytoskeletal protein CcmA (bactofilin family)
MAIFNSNDARYQDKETSKSTTIITSGSSIKGEMNLECNLYVDGEFDGSIFSSKQITIGKNGKVKGEIKANHLIVQGYVDGKLSVEKVVIKEGGKISGTVESKEFIIEPRGLFEGNSIIKKESKKTQKADISKS